MKKSSAICVVCDARIPQTRRLSPRVDTCSTLCTRAKKAGNTRMGQILWEMQQEDKAARQEIEDSVRRRQESRQRTADIDYNSPQASQQY